MSLVGQCELGMAHLARPDHLIGLLRRWNERLLHVDMATVFGRSNGHLSMLINPARSDSDNLQSLFVEHFAVVCVRSCSLRAFLGVATSRFVLVSNRDNFGLGDISPDRINSVSVASFSRPTNHADSQPFSHCRPLLLSPTHRSLLIRYTACGECREGINDLHESC